MGGPDHYPEPGGNERPRGPGRGPDAGPGSPRAESTQRKAPRRGIRRARGRRVTQPSPGGSPPPKVGRRWCPPSPAGAQQGPPWGRWFKRSVPPPEQWPVRAPPTAPSVPSGGTASKDGRGHCPPNCPLAQQTTWLPSGLPFWAPILGSLPWRDPQEGVVKLRPLRRCKRLRATRQGSLCSFAVFIAQGGWGGPTDFRAFLRQNRLLSTPP